MQRLKIQTHSGSQDLSKVLEVSNAVVVMHAALLKTQRFLKAQTLKENIKFDRKLTADQVFSFILFFVPIAVETMWEKLNVSFVSDTVATNKK